MRLILLISIFFTLPAWAYNEKYTPDVDYNRDSQYWDQRREMMKGGKIKRIADKCQEYTQLHGDMAERANGWLYRFAVPYGGSNAFIDRPTHFKIEKRIIAIHGQLREDNRWERHGAAVAGAEERCKNNAVKASQQIIELMKPFGAVYMPDKNDWTESWKK